VSLLEPGDFTGSTSVTVAFSETATVHGFESGAS
jgi:hypothetical protein